MTNPQGEVPATGPRVLSDILKIPDITDAGKLACLARSRKFKQYCKAVNDALVGRCPFCQIDWNYNEKVAETRFWYVWLCKPPENHTILHLLIVPKRHITDSCDLTDEEVIEKHRLNQQLKDRFALTSRGQLCRDGDATLSAGTIEHLHFHIMVPDGTGRVESPFYKGAESEAEGIARAIVFEKMRKNQEQLKIIRGESTVLLSELLSTLSPEERALVEDRLG